MEELIKSSIKIKEETNIRFKEYKKENKITTEEAIKKMLDECENSMFAEQKDSEIIIKTLNKSDKILRENLNLTEVILEALNLFFKEEKPSSTNENDNHYFIEQAKKILKEV